MFELEMKSKELINLISQMTVRECGGNALFSPLIANVDPKAKTISWSWITNDHTAFVWGEARKLKLGGKAGQYVFDAELIDWVGKLFGAEEVVKMTHSGASVHLKGDKFEAQYNPTDADAARIEEATKLKVKDNLPVFKDFKWKEVTIKTSELKTILSPTTLVYSQKEIKVVKLIFDKKGSTAIVGSLEAHSTGISRPIEAKVKGNFEITLGSNFSEVISVLDGEIELYGIDAERPLWLLKKDKDTTIGYLVAQYDEVQERAKKEAEEEVAEEDAEEEEESEEKEEDAESSELDLGDED
jgi:hypothetical protein